MPRVPSVAGPGQSLRIASAVPGAGRPAWDAHNSIVENHGRHAPEVDKPIAGLIMDLKRRGLLDETLVVMMGS